MGSAVLPPVTMEAMSRNMIWDGLFHAATWMIALVGVRTLGESNELGDESKLLALAQRFLICEHRMFVSI